MFSAPVTAVKIIQNHRICFAGTGPYVIVFDLNTNEQLLQEKIFDQSIVHGFEIRQITDENDDDQSYLIVIFGQRKFSIAQWSNQLDRRKSLNRITTQISSPSWILTALIQDDSPTIQSVRIVFGTALNQIYRYFHSMSDQNTLVLTQSFKYTTLYSALLFRNSTGRIIFAAGTVFGELILYEQDTNGLFNEKCNVSDHNGAIFGITSHGNLLSTVGDDRTVKLYNFDDKLQLLSSFFAHDARIWKSSLTSTLILTCGEDSSIRVWSQQSPKKNLRCFSVHRCKSCWSIDILRDENDDQPLAIVSGWSDGTVRRYHLDDVPYDSHLIIPLNPTLNNDFPRNIVFIDQANLLVHMSSGQLLMIKDQSSVSLFYDGRSTLKNAYAKMAATKDGQELIAVGSLDGRIFIFDKASTIIDEIEMEGDGNKKILQLLWLNNSSKLLVCLPDGLMFIYQIEPRQSKMIYQLNPLPDFEQRWPNACLYLEQSEILLIGDRQGNLLLYDLQRCGSNKTYEIHQELLRLHGTNGTSSIDFDDHANLIRSCGRDGYVNLFTFDEQQRRLIHQNTLTISADINWLDRLINQPSLITCFTTNHFCLFNCDEQSRRRLMEIDCGGGHRNNDFIIDNNLEAHFAYVRNKRVHIARKQLRRILNEANCLSRIPPGHGIEIRCVKLFQHQDHFCLITGSEDTQMKVFKFNSDLSTDYCEHLSTLQSHLSAVCDIVIIDRIIFSCGARAQLFAWQIRQNLIKRSGYFMLHPLRRRHGGGAATLSNDAAKETIEDDHGLDVRFTSVAAMSTSDEGIYVIFVTGSDAILRVFRYTSISNRITLLQTSSYSDYCQLRVKVHESTKLVFVSSTDGQICAYDYASLEVPVRNSTCKIHQSGVNDFDLISTGKNNQEIRLISVGDDGSVHVSLFHKTNWSWTREFSRDFTHQSPATGIRFLSPDTIISIGIDQRLKLWKIDSDSNNLQLLSIHFVDIRDILSMDRIFCEKTGLFLITVAGAGIQTIRFDPIQLTFHS